MRTTNEKHCKTGMDGMTAVELTQHLTAADTPAKHRENLHIMMVGWLRNRNHDPSPQPEQESVYLTYLLLKDMLETMEGGER